MQRQTQVAAYWTSKFQLTRSDIEFLFSQFLEAETPLSTRDLALRLIRYRLTQEDERLRKQVARGELFQPKASYQIGQELIFPAYNYSMGKVIAQRAGRNPDAGDFTVIEVEFEDKQRREFASTLQTPHALNLDEMGGQRFPELDPIDPQSIFSQYGETIMDEIEAKLVDQEDAVSFGDRWFLRSLLINVNIGHLNLAEALLDMAEGGPIFPASIVKDIDLAKPSQRDLAEFALNIAMSADDRFDNVGGLGQIQWFLRRLEPPEVAQTPLRLLYPPLDYDRSLINGELAALEAELDDELSDLPVPVDPMGEVILTLIYPHRRIGTLPLSSKIKGFFPPASDGQRIRVTFVDAQDNTEFAGWVVHEDRYVYGLDSFYRRHRLPIGAYVTVRKTDDPTRIILDFPAHRPHTEYIRLAVPSNGRLTFANFKRSIGARYDELLILGAEDIEGVDSVWGLTRDRKRGLVEIMRDLIPELARLTPQNAVHAKTLYSAVNVVRRCPPGPIFAALASRSDFQNVAGPYWRLAN